MSELLTLKTRQRGRFNAIRSGEVRPRIKKILTRIGDSETTRTMLCHRAVQLGRERGLRVWSGNTFKPEVGALSSLRILLKEKETKNGRGQVTTGVNDGWVLDLWEIVCEYYENCALNLEQKREETARAPQTAPLAASAPISPLERAVSERWVIARNLLDALDLRLQPERIDEHEQSDDKLGELENKAIALSQTLREIRTIKRL